MQIRQIKMKQLTLKSSPSESVNYIINDFAYVGYELAQNLQSGNMNQSPLSSIASTQVAFVLLGDDCEAIHSLWSSDKFTSILVVPIMTHPTNLCFTKGVFPAPLKEALITSVHKG